MSTAVCSHLDTIEFTAIPDPVVGCDDSPNRHASTHAREVSHPIIKSAEPGEGWSRCYVDKIAFVVG
jgi:hypothetical protein